MEYLISYIIIAVESVSFLLLCTACLQWRPARRAGVTPTGRLLLTWLTFTSVIFVFVYLFNGPLWLKYLLSVLLHVALACIFWQRDLPAMFSVAVLYNALNNGLECMVEGVIWAFVGANSAAILTSPSGFILLAVATKAPPPVMSLYLHRVLRQGRGQQGWRGWARVLTPASILMVFCVFIAKYLLDNGPVSSQLAAAISFAVCAAFLYIIQISCQNTAAQLRKKSEEELVRQLREQRALLHDTANFSLTLQQLLEQGEQAEVQALLRQQVESLGTAPQYIHTGNAVADAVLNDQCTRAAEQGIQLFVEICSLKDLAMQELDIVVVLSNLLDNARNACMACPAGRRRLSIQAVPAGDDMVRLTIRNTCAEPEGAAAPQESAKKAARAARAAKRAAAKQGTKTGVQVAVHGYGRQNVQKVLKKYGCGCIAGQEGDWYRVLMLLPCPADAETDVAADAVTDAAADTAAGMAADTVEDTAADAAADTAADAAAKTADE